MSCNPSSQHSVPSRDLRLIATVLESRLLIRSATNAAVVQAFQIPRDVEAHWPFLRWSGSSARNFKVVDQVQDSKAPIGASRVLLANDDAVLIWDVNNPQWHATINGTASNLGKVATVDFGFTADEVLVFSVFNVKATIWFLNTSKGVEIRDPKSPSNCYDYRPCTGHMALLTRAGAHDTLLLLSPVSYEVHKSVELPTIDAQGVKWSPDGQWIAIWDATSFGYKVLVYTADGNLFKTYSGNQDAENIELGVKLVKWSPLTDSLTIGDSNRRVTILQKNSFSPINIMEHTSMIDDPQVLVWQEQISATHERSYVQASPPTCPKGRNADLAGLNIGVAIIEYNIDGSLFVTRDDATPSTVWVWSPKQPFAAAVLIHHSSVKKVLWHPVINDLLLMHCNVAEPVIHLWNPAWKAPKVIRLPLLKLGGRMEASWLHVEASNSISLMVGNAQNYVDVHLDYDGELTSSFKKAKLVGAGPEDMFDEGNSLDLSPIKILHDEPRGDTEDDFLTYGQPGQWNVAEDVDDTFYYRRHVKGPT